ncbi:MAG: RNA-binding protein [Candidatus Paceibacterota bacterium]|jgi:RNA recognition motif-containing protein
MAKKLYVGGIPYTSTADALKNFFQAAGPVASSTIITDKMTGRSRGFGFVEMENDADADRAVEQFHGKEFEGRTLTVNEAKPREEGANRERRF